MIDDLDFGYADGSVCAPDLRYAFALALGALVVAAALAAWGIRKMRMW